MAINKDYLRFDALSIKKGIEQKLTENTNYTDHIYPGSDLSVFVDIVANAYQVLTYYINQTGSEAIATDSQFYENINRIVKFLDYHPNGYTTSVIDGIISGVPSGLNNNILPAYSSVVLSDTDENGDPITFSTTDYYYVYDDDTITDGSITNELPLYNGKWTIYELPLVAEGIPYETFALDSLYSSADRESYVAFPYVHAFIKRDDEWLIFKPSPTSLFINTETQRVYTSQEKVFELRLNEFKQVELKFGDGIYAQKLQKGDVIYVAYLKSNGPAGQIDTKKFNNANIVTDITGFEKTTLKTILQDQHSNLVNDTTTFNIPNEITIQNFNASSFPVQEETVEQIKEFAPKAFRSGGKLITKNDYDYFIRSNYYKDIVDIKIQNNWSYLKTFMRWLYLAGITFKNDAGYYLGNSLKYRHGYEWTDSCDFNNIYVWIQMKTGITVPKSEMLRHIQSVKTLTGEIVFMDPVIVNFVPCAFDKSYDIQEWDADQENYIEIELNTTTIESPQRIRSRVNNIIVGYFENSNQTIGSTIDMNDITAQILALDGVERIRTIFTSGTDVVKVNGLRFMKWSSNILEGVDREFVNGTIQLEPFMFPRLLEISLKDRIKVITESAYQTNEVEY